MSTLTVGLDTVEHLKLLQAEPFEVFDDHPLSLAVHQLGNPSLRQPRGPLL